MRERQITTGGVPVATIRRAWGWPALIVLSILLSACARFLSAPPRDYSTPFANDVFEAGFDFVDERYFEPLELEVFVLAGLAGLAEIDPAIESRLAGDSVEISVGTTRAARLRVPDRDDARQWAALTTDAIDAARLISAPLNEAEAEQIFEAVFDGAVENLDGFSRYAGLEAANDARALREGFGFGGIGIAIRMEDNDAVILSVTGDTPAAKAGLQAEDRLTQVDGEAIAGWTQRQLVRHLRGEINSTVVLTIARTGTGPSFDVPIRRKRIVLPTVEARRSGRVGVIRVSSFNQRTAEAVRAEVARLRREEGEDLDGFVLDLRDNPGGLLDQAVEVADVFLRDGEIVRTRGRHPHSRQQYTASGRDYSEDKPLVVLINGDSASASEVVAAALQDRGRAVVVGTNSYGKGTVQTIYRLPNNGELPLTWSRLHAPSGYLLHGLGVLPNVCAGDGQPPAAASRLVERLRHGDTITQGVLSDWRSINASVDEQRLDTMRNVCPSAKGSPESDLKLAQEILGDPALYVQALEPLLPSVARR